MDQPTETQPSPSGRRERRKLEVRNRITVAAQALFNAQGFDETTVDQIAEAADIAPATFFNHFQGKQALLAQMAERVVVTLDGLTRHHLEGEASSAERLRALVSSSADELHPRRRVARLVLLELIREAGPDQPTPYLGRIHAPIAALIEEGQQRGEFRSDQDSVFLAQMTVGMLNAGITQWLSDADHPVEQGLIEITEFVIAVLQPPTVPA